MEDVIYYFYLSRAITGSGWRFIRYMEVEISAGESLTRRRKC